MKRISLAQLSSSRLSRTQEEVYLGGHACDCSCSYICTCSCSGLNDCDSNENDPRETQLTHVAQSNTQNNKLVQMENPYE